MNINKIFIFMLLILGLGIGVNAFGLQESNTVDDGVLSNSVSNFQSQSFTTTSSYNLTNVLLNLAKVGSPSGDLFVSIYTESADKPITLLAISSGISASSVGVGASYINFSGISLTTNLSNSVKYVLVMSHTGTHDGSNNIVLHGSFDSDYAGGRSGSGATVPTIGLWGSGFDYNFQNYDLNVPITILPTLTFTNITANNITLLNNTFYNSSIDFQTTVLNTSTNGDVNHSYFLTSNNSLTISSNQKTITNVTSFVSNDLISKNALCLQNTGTNYISHSVNAVGVDIAVWNGTSWIDGFGQGVSSDVVCGGSVQYATNSLIGSVNLNLSEGIYNISFQGVNNVTLVNSTNYTFTVDKTNPIITNNIPSEINSYDFDGSLFSCTDTNLVSCNISIDGFNKASGVNFTLIHNGNLTYNITSTDLAGNTLVDSGVVLINPIQLFNFQLSNGTAIPDFTFGGIGFSNQSNITTYNSIISLGNNTLLFEKVGFASTNVTFNLNTTSIINLTINITQSQINIRIFDRETNVLLTGLTAITIQATTGFNGSTTTGLLNVSNINFVSEQYQILAEHEGYSTENVFFNYNNQETINVDIFMLNATAPEEGQIKIIVKNTLSQFVESAVCSALEWRPSESAFVSVGQGLSNVIGETLLNIELNTKIYKFSCTKDTFTTVTNGQIVQIADSSLTIILNDVILAPTPLFPNLVTSLTNSSINSTHQLITYTFADADGLTTQACLNVYLVNGNRQSLNQQNCVSSSTGTILLTVNINQTSDILIQGALTTSEIIGYVTDSLTIKGIGDIAGQFKVIGLDVLIPTILILVGLGLGILLSKIEIAAVFVAIAGWVSVAFVPTIMASAIAMFISVVVGLMLWGGYNRK